MTPPEVRFWRLVDRFGGPDACWLWKGATSKKGHDRYGSFRTETGMIPAHRVALALSDASCSFPEALAKLSGKDVMHSCDTPLCCNGAHLSSGTRLDNMQDCARKGRLRFCRCGARRLQHSGADHMGPCEKTGCGGFVAKGAS